MANPNNSTSQPRTPDSQPHQEDLSFQVMPTSVGGSSKPVALSDPPTAAKPQPVQQHTPTKARGKLWYMAITIIVLGFLGAGAYFFLGDFTKDQEQETQSKLPSVWLQQQFGVDTCLDINECGDEADPDEDGLSNYNEFKARGGADPNDNDTDDDGLADGDEVHIFLTEPAFAFSFCRDNGSIACQYNDGSQISNDYDPSTPGIMMTDTRKQQIADDTETYKLHEPTPTTLGGTGASQQTDSTNPGQTASQSHSVFIEGNKFLPDVIQINANDSIVWLNKDTTVHEVASDPHPTHTNFPDLHSPVLSQSQTFSLKFTTQGTFTYHDHLNSSITGSVIVK